MKYLSVICLVLIMMILSVSYFAEESKQSLTGDCVHFQNDLDYIDKKDENDCKEIGDKKIYIEIAAISSNSKNILYK